MSLKVAVQMDPMESIGIEGDSTFALMLEAQARGHSLYHYEVRHMTLREGTLRPGGAREERLFARARPVTVQRVKGDHFKFGAEETLDLGTTDVVLMRQDPPFDMAYITATHMLERIHPRTLVVNDPFHVRNAPEKLFVTQFEGVMPPTLIATDREEIRAFRAKHGDYISGFGHRFHSADPARLDAGGLAFRAMEVGDRRREQRVRPGVAGLGHAAAADDCGGDAWHGLRAVADLLEERRILGADGVLREET